MTSKPRIRARALVLGLAAGALLPPSGAAAHRWGGAVAFSSPRASDLSPAVLAVSPSGRIAAAFSAYNADDPSAARAYLSMRASSRGRPRVRAVPGAQEVLALAWSGSRLFLLSAEGAGGQPCCARVELVAFAGGRFGRGHLIAGRLASVAVGGLEALPQGGILAAVATAGAVWAAQSGRGARIGPVRRLGGAASAVLTLDGAVAASGASTVAWLAARAGARAATRLIVAHGSPRAAPARPRLVWQARPGHALDELALAAPSTGPTAAWIDSWFDRRGAHHADVELAGLAPRRLRPRGLGVRGQLASGLVLASGGHAREVLAFKSCDAAGACWVRAAYRAGAGRFSGPERVGAIDPPQEPAAAVSANGTAAVAWVYGGSVYAMWRGPGARRWGAVHRLSPSGLAAAETLSGGPGSEIVAAWTQGTLAPSIVGALLR